ncbi:MAG TPA: Rieske (2Fe-2S) protein [Spongiibacteraceae bacterium]|nr:Rieske (2Fe-2S) protein [Spongiibacteraceae bacterium]
MNFRIPLCAVDTIAEGSAKGFDADGASIFALKFDGQIHVYRNSCPHLGVELNWLEDQFFDLDGTFIQCATHGALFDPITGRCVSGPCRGRVLQAVTSHVENGQLYLGNTPQLIRE